MIPFMNKTQLSVSFLRCVKDFMKFHEPIEELVYKIIVKFVSEIRIMFVNCLVQKQITICYVK